MYSPQLLNHFANPRNTGVVENPDAAAQCENPVCGDVLKLTARIVDGRVGEIRFQAKGCVPAIACGSALTELVWGRTLQEALLMGRDDVVRLLGELPPASGHAADLAVATLRALIAELSAHTPR